MKDKNQKMFLGNFFLLFIHFLFRNKNISMRFDLFCAIAQKKNRYP